MTFHISPTAPFQAKSSCLILFASEDGKAIHLDLKGAGCEKSAQMITKAHKESRFSGRAKETVFFRGAEADGFDHVLAVGVGQKNKIDEESLRIAAAAAAKALGREKISSATLSLQSFRRMTKNAESAGRAVAEGFVLGSYKYEEMKSKKKQDNQNDRKLTDIYFALNEKPALQKFAAGLKIGQILAEATCLARDLGNAPANWMTPTMLAEKAHEAAKGLPIKFHALNKKQIEDLKMGCLLGVNKGSKEEPRFIVMEYHGGKKADKPLVLVGKGLTFDTGGISIKPAPQMEEMKFDMCGGAAVIGAIVALAKLKAKVNVVTLVPSTENMPGGAAVKPGDVLVAMNGKTVEVNNTDAEGRLILADALAYACEKYKPAAILDAATLTGACVMALGNVFAGFFCKEPKLHKKILAAAESSGERIWRLPLVDEYVDDMKGTYGDLTNVGNAKGGGSCQGAAFLSQFVEEGIPWAHFDIAGSAYHTGNRYLYNPDKGASGSAVRLFADIGLNF